MWPVSKKTALNNRFVKEGPRRGCAPATKSNTTSSAPDFLDLMAGLSLKTPKSSMEVNDFQRQLVKIDPIFGNATARLLFRKLGKSLNEATFQYTTSEQQNEQLLAALEKAKPKKKKKVVPDPNSKFVRLKDVRKVQEGMKGLTPKPTRVTRSKKVIIEKEEESEHYSDDEDCIVVRPMKV